MAAETVNNKSILRKTCSGVWRVSKILMVLYVMSATLVGTFFIIIHSYLFYSSNLKPRDLPNGYTLAPTFFNNRDIQILDDGDQVVSSVGAVMWCNDVIYGSRTEHKKQHGAITSVNGSSVTVSYEFIYDRRSEKLEQFETTVSRDVAGNRYITTGSYESKAFKQRLEELGVPAYSDKKFVTWWDLSQYKYRIPEGETCSQTEYRQEVRG